MLIRGLYCLGILMLFSLSARGQISVSFDKGSVTFLSSQNVYAKFASTEKINLGDTLYLYGTDKMIPALVVSNKSSISCVCTPLVGLDQLKVGTEIAAKSVAKPEVAAKPEETPPVPGQAPVKVEAPPTVVTPDQEEEHFDQKIRARLSAASYSRFSNQEPSHRMRYAFTMRADNIRDSRFSVDCNITFRHTVGEWADVQDNLASALKVYGLSANYDFRGHASLSLGRRINSRISNMGAIDGIQFEKGFKNFVAGAIAGSRPNFQDYSFDPSLLQFGAYIGHTSNKDSKYVQTTLAIIDQRNQLITDRRFLYFQHSNSLIKNLNVFSSFEVDLFQRINNEAKNTLSLTNIFVSLRYRVSRKLNFSASYDARKNIIYYESYKNYIDQLIEDETRQGLRVGVNLRPFKYLTWGTNVSWRFQKSSANDSKNLNSFLTYSRIPLLNASATLTANLLQTGYLNSKMFGLRLSKDFFKGKLGWDLYVRMVDYHYMNYEYTTTNYIGGTSLNLRVMHNLGLYLYYEGTLDDQSRIYHLFNTKLIQRF